MTYKGPRKIGDGGVNSDSISKILDELAKSLSDQGYEPSEVEIISRRKICRHILKERVAISLLETEVANRKAAVEFLEQDWT